MTDDVGLVGGLIQVIGLPNNFAGYVIIYTIAGILFLLLIAIIFNAMFRRW